MNQVYFYCAQDSLIQQYNSLVQILNHATQVINQKNNFYLELGSQGLIFHASQFSTAFNLTKYYNDFLIKRKLSIKQELLISATGIKNPKNKIVLDLFAGLGRDGILLALFGFSVVMVENNPYLILILNYLLLSYPQTLAAIKIHYGDNLDYIKNYTNSCELIYLDPMFKQVKNSLAKKDLQLINMVQPVSNYDINQLFSCCYGRCKLIVKRDNKQKSLVANPRPNLVKLGNTVRYDIYD